MNKPIIAAIDDEQLNLELISFTIAKMDYDFIGIQHSESAIDVLLDRVPDLILMDVQMPKLNGYELCIQLKTIPILKSIPIIFLTGMTKTENKVRGFELGGVDYVTKPFHKQELIARIKTHINLVRATKKVQEQSAILERDIVLKNRLFSIIGHDLRSPLSAIKLKLDFILRGIIKTTDDTFIDNTINGLYATTTEAFSLLENLLGWAKSESELLNIIPEAINVKEIAEQNKRLNQMALNNKEITFTIDVPEEAAVMADLNMLNTIIRNLLSNAIKFTPKKGTISFKAKPQDTSKWVICIQDSGTGMSPEDLIKVQSSTEHFSKEGTEQEAGSGLGLVLCQDFIQKNGGEFIITSELGVGSCFSFTLKAPNKSE